MFNPLKLKFPHLKNKDNTSQSHCDDSKHNPWYALSPASGTEFITKEILAFIVFQSTISYKCSNSLSYQMLSSCTPGSLSFQGGPVRILLTLDSDFFFLSSNTFNLFLQTHARLIFIFKWILYHILTCWRPTR